MNAFQFRLQRVLEFRRTLFQAAESECQRAAAKLQAVRAQQAALASRKFETRRTFANRHEVSGTELAPLSGWFEWTAMIDGQLSRMERAAVAELETRRGALIDAQRQVRLLEKLRDQRQLQWKAEFEREIEELAADSTNSRFSRREKETRSRQVTPAQP